MKYQKKPLTYSEQADLLISRGLVVKDRNELISKLKSVNYYRLSGYIFPYKKPKQENFYEGTTFEKIWNRYRFDRQLRLLVIDGIERIEVALKTDIAYQFSHANGTFAYINRESLPCIPLYRYLALINQIQNEMNRSQEQYINNFKIKYGDNHEIPPLWIAVELMTFGSMVSFFCGLPPYIARNISNKYCIPYPVFVSWLKALQAVRNTCAHHGRLWNKELGFKPKIPRKNNLWNKPQPINNNKLFSILTILKHLGIIVAPQSNWSSRLKQLLKDFSDIPLKSMGFPDNWESYKLWENPKM